MPVVAATGGTPEPRRRADSVWYLAVPAPCQLSYSPAAGAGPADHGAALVYKTTSGNASRAAVPTSTVPPGAAPGGAYGTGRLPAGRIRTRARDWPAPGRP